MANTKANPANTAKKPAGSKRGWIVLLAVLGVIAALAGVYFAEQQHNVTAERTDFVIEGLLGSSTFISPYDPDEWDDFLEYYNDVCEKGYFKKTLAAVFDEYATVALYNSGFTDGPVEEKRDTRYEKKPEVPGVRTKFSKAIGVLASLGYEDEALRNSAERIFTDGLTQVDAASDIPALLSAARNWSYNLDRLNAWNEGGGSFYRLEVPAQYNEDATRDLYRQAVRLSVESGDAERLARTLETVGEAPLMQGVTVLEPREILDALVPNPDRLELLTLRRGEGGYYDSAEKRRKLASGLRETLNASDFYGDFYSSSYTSGGNKYDMTEFNNNPGLWQALTPGQRAVIQEGNRIKTHYRRYCRDEKVNCGDVEGNAKSGMRYCYRLGEKDFLYIGDNGINWNGFDIPGDYSEIVKELRKEYAARRAARSAEEAAAS